MPRRVSASLRANALTMKPFAISGTLPASAPTAANNNLHNFHTMTAKRILLVHEDRLLANMYRERLEHGGFTVDSARTGDAALRAIAERPPDLVVLDSVIAEPNSVRLISTLRRDAGTRDLPVVCLPTSRLQLAEEAQTAGAT